MDLGLRQGDVAKTLGADAASVANWELGHTQPALRFLPAIIQFLGHDPRPEPLTLGGRLRHAREALGWSREILAKEVGVDPSTIAAWELEGRRPEMRGFRARNAYALAIDITRQRSARSG